MKKIVVLTAIAALAFTLVPAAQAALVVHYKLDETSGTTVSDSVGSNNGTVDGAFGSVGGSPDPTSSAAYNTANNGELLYGETGLASSQANYTLMFWLNSSAIAGRWFSIGEDTATTQEIVFQGEKGEPGEYEAFAYNLNGTTATGEYEVFFGADTSFITTGGWDHHAVTVSGSTLTWFVNGVEIDSGTIGGLGNADASKFTLLGSLSQTPGIVGSVDEVGVFDTALTQ